jgi:hypothetical protein
VPAHHGRDHHCRPCAPCNAEGCPFQGVFFAGLMITAKGPQLIEYNVRFGDPECQVLMMRLKDDLVTLMLAACDGTLDKVSVRWRDEAALTVVMAAKGYPGDVTKGSEIRNLEAAGPACRAHLPCRHQGRWRQRILANGGRVLNVTARGQTVTRRRRLPTPRSMRLTGHKGSAAATSAGGPSNGRRRKAWLSCFRALRSIPSRATGPTFSCAPAAAAIRCC